MTSPDSPMLPNALHFAEIGLPVIPVWNVTGSGCACGSATCSCPGKHPLGLLVPNGVHDASTDPQVIREWWSQYPDANIGVATGSVSGIVVLDIDGAEGERSLQQLQDQHGVLPTTAEQRTGRGRHLFFHIYGNRRVSNSASRLGQGLDIRGEGGYVVVAPSRHISGMRYQWVGDPLTNVASLPILPSFLTEPRRQHAPRRANVSAPINDVNARAEIQTAADIVRNAREGTRNDSVNREAFRLGKGLGPNSEHLPAARTALRRAALEAGLDDAEVDRTLRSGFEAGCHEADSRNGQWPALTTGSEVEIARAVLEQLQERYTHVGFFDGAIHVFNGTHWVLLDPHALRRQIQAFDGANLPSGRPLRLSSRMIDGVLREIPAMLERHDIIETAPMGIGCRSGFIRIFDDGSASIECHDPLHGRQHILSANWPPCWSRLRQRSLLKQLLTGCFAEDPDIDAKIDLIGEVAGAIVLGCASTLRDAKAFILLGESAQNGKSQILEVFRGLVPPEASVSIPLALLGDQAHLAQLQGKMLNAVDELDPRDVRSLGLLKRAVTGEPVMARQLYCNPVQFRPRAQHVFATNKLPRIHGTLDAGLERRIQILTFTRRIPADERIPAIGRRIIEKESDRLLAFAVAGARRLLRQGHFTEPESSRHALAQWLMRADPVQAWINNGQVAVIQSDGPQTVIRTGEIFEAFVLWVQNSGLGPEQIPNISVFSRRIRDLLPNCGYRRMSHGGEFLNLCLTPHAPRGGVRRQAGLSL